MINKKYLIKVKEHTPECLTPPRLRKPTKKDPIKQNRCETLDEIEIVFVECDLNEI